jgi:UDP-glucose 4-epimerase
MQRVLVTGGAGFIGAYTVRALARAQHMVVIYDWAVRNNTLDLLVASEDAAGRAALESQVTIVPGSITDGWALQRACESHAVDAIVHLASPLTEDVTLQPLAGIDNICRGTATVFEVARAQRIRRVVWASSVGVFGQAPGEIQPGGGSISWAPTLYGSCKQLCEIMARRYWEADSVDSIGLRLTVVYGCGRLRGFMSYPSRLIRDVATGLPIQIPFGAQPMNWQYVEDVASLIAHCIQAEALAPGEVFTTSGDVRTYSEAAGVLRRLAPEVDIECVDGTDPALDAVPMSFDQSALEAALGFATALPMEQGITAAYSRYRRLLESEDGQDAGRQAGLWPPRATAKSPGL